VPDAHGQFPDESSDTVGTKADEARKDRASGEQGAEPLGGIVTGSRSAWVDRAISENFSDGVEVETHFPRSVLAMVAKAGQHFIHTVRGRWAADLVEKNAGEIIPGKQFKKPTNCLRARGRIVRAHEAERLLHSVPFVGPASPAAATFAPPVHDKV
jgi:hypothetical protein